MRSGAQNSLFGDGPVDVFCQSSSFESDADSAVELQKLGDLENPDIGRQPKKNYVRGDEQRSGELVEPRLESPSPDVSSALVGVVRVLSARQVCEECFHVSDSSGQLRRVLNKAIVCGVDGVDTAFNFGAR